MRLPDLNELAEMVSDSEKGVRYFVYRYTERDRKLGAKGRLGVGKAVGRQMIHLGYFDCAKDVRSFFDSMISHYKEHYA